MHSLLTHLEDSSQVIMAELHTDKWHPYHWFHWIFPTSECVPGEMGEASAVTHRTVADFVSEDTFAWREALDRIVGKAEITVGGLLGLFPAAYMARIDCFIGIFAAAPKRAQWLFVLLGRLRRLRAWGGGPLPPGFKPAVSRPSRRVRIAAAAEKLRENIARSRVLPGEEGLLLESSAPREGLLELAGVTSARVQAVEEVGELALAERKRPKRFTPYHRRLGGNALIDDLLYPKAHTTMLPVKSARYRPHALASVLDDRPLIQGVARLPEDPSL